MISTQIQNVFRENTDVFPVCRLEDDAEVFFEGRAASGRTLF